MQTSLSTGKAGGGSGDSSSVNYGTYPEVLAAENYVGSAATFAFTKPVDLEDGDWLIYLTYRWDNYQTTTGTLLTDFTQRVVTNTSGGADRTAGIWTKIITDATSEPATYTLGFAAADQCGATLLHVRGVDMAHELSGIDLYPAEYWRTPVVTEGQMETSVDGRLIISVIGTYLSGSGVLAAHANFDGTVIYTAGAGNGSYSVISRERPDKGTVPILERTWTPQKTSTSSDARTGSAWIVLHNSADTEA